MVEIHGWLVVCDESDAVAEGVFADLSEMAEELPNSQFVCRSGVRNGVRFIAVNGAANRTSQVSSSIRDIWRSAASSTTSSYGILHWFDDDCSPYSPVARVLLLRAGELTEDWDPLEIIDDK